MSCVLVVDDDVDILFAAKMFLKKHVNEVITESNPNKIPSLLNDHDVDVVLLDMNFTKDTTSGKEGFSWLKEIKEKNPSTVVILITAFGDVSMAVEAIKRGASDFILKPWTNEKLLATLKSALELSRSKSRIELLENENKFMKKTILETDSEILGVSKEMKEVFEKINKVAASEANILITGENGTGKELVAKEVHRLSNRKDNIFISVDVGALTDTLFESELFGHVKGAFTGATESKKGRFELANNGTIFLDEIGNITPDKQMKLLTVLQNREVKPVGSTKTVKLDIRVISATNMPIKDMIASGDFRQDLLYRLNTVTIDLPPLRSRGEDILLLADHFLNIYSVKYKKKQKELSPESKKCLGEYKWEGNIRELQHTIERAVLLSDNDQITVDNLSLNSQIETESLEKTVDSLNLEEMEKILITKALKQYSGNLTKAARELGLTRQALYRRMEKYEL